MCDNNNGPAVQRTTSMPTMLRPSLNGVCPKLPMFVEAVEPQVAKMAMVVDHLEVEVATGGTTGGEENRLNLC